MLGLTLITAIAVSFRGRVSSQRAVILIMAQWIGYNFLHNAGLAAPASNLVVDIIILFFFYANYFYARLGVYFAMLVLFVARIAWHCLAASYSIPRYTYAEGCNSIYVGELFVLWMALRPKINQK